MNLVVDVLVPFLGGMALGAFFFGGLWLTIRHGMRSAWAPLWLAASSLVRLAAALGGMYWLTSGRWEKLLPCVAGFYLARHLVTRFAGAPCAPAAAEGEKENIHAS